MAQFELEITTPEKRFFDEPVEMVVLPATDGELGVLADLFRAENASRMESQYNSFNFSWNFTADSLSANFSLVSRPSPNVLKSPLRSLLEISYTFSICPSMNSTKRLDRAAASSIRSYSSGQYFKAFSGSMT